MKTFNSLFPILLLFFSYSLSAQLSANDQLWSGGLSLYSTDTRTDIQANPTFQYFLSSRFSIGGQLGIRGSAGNGLEQILLLPEIRYYLNPRAEKINWFASLGSKFDVYDGEAFTGDTRFQLKPGLGANIQLADGLALESQLSLKFERIGNNSFLENPGFSFEAGFVHLAKRTTGSDPSLWPRIGKGTWLTGGKLIRVDFSNSNSIKSRSATIAPSVGYFLSDRLLVGLDLNLSYNYLKTDFTIAESNIESRSFGLTVNPFIRYYTARPESKVQPYLELRAGLNYKETRSGPNSADPFLISRAYSAGIGGGVDIFLSKNTALETGLSLGKDLKTGQTQLGLQMGLKFFLNCRK